MISKNTELLLTLEDYFDYQSYSRLCEANGLIPETRGVFLQKAGLLEGARRDNRDDVLNAYLAILTEMNRASEALLVNNSGSRKLSTPNCGNCGGGKVL